MYLRDDPAFEHHRKTWGEHTEFGYKDFIPMLTAEKFDAAEWAQLFKDAGARFVMPVAEHHDGFPMYDSDLTDWCAAKMGPKRDICGELAEPRSGRRIWSSRCLIPSRRALVVLRWRARFPLGCAGSRQRRLVRTGG